MLGFGDGKRGAGRDAMKWELHPQQAALSRALYVIRLRLAPFRSGGRWITIPQSRRVREQRSALERLRPNKWTPKPWHPPEGRESPREELMAWRRSMVRYEYPGCMRHKHGKGPPLVGSPLLYAIPHD